MTEQQERRTDFAVWRVRDCPCCEKPHSTERLCARCGQREGLHTNGHPHWVNKGDGAECDGFQLRSAS